MIFKKTRIFHFFVIESEKNPSTLKSTVCILYTELNTCIDVFDLH